MALKQGSLALVGLWLANQVGEGGVFTKQQLRTAIPDIEQADRRMRDLRNYGWEISTNRQDATLRPNELRLVQVGEPVWSESFRPRSSPRVTSKERVMAMSRANFRCEFCGVGLDGAPGPSGVPVRLQVLKLNVGLRVACNECGSGSEPAMKSAQERFKQELRGLYSNDLERLEARLGEADDQVETAFNLAQSLPSSQAMQLVRAEREARDSRSG